MNGSGAYLKSVLGEPTRDAIALRPIQAASILHWDGVVFQCNSLVET
jgi:hypothetical protein